MAGYTCGNDVTARDLQKVDGQWTRAKSFDTFCPLGPTVVRDAPPPEAAVTAAIDGDEVQHGRVGDMIVSPLDLLVFISGIMTLEAGDVILTGTPPGVGPLAPARSSLSPSRAWGASPTRWSPAPERSGPPGPDGRSTHARRASICC